MGTVLTALLLVSGFAVPILTYKMGYHTGRAVAAREAIESLRKLEEKETARAERRMRGDEG